MFEVWIQSAGEFMAVKRMDGGQENKECEIHLEEIVSGVFIFQGFIIFCCCWR